MPQKTLQEQINYVLDTVIKNLHPNVYDDIVNEILDLNIRNTKDAVTKFVTNKLKLTGQYKPSSRQYWTLRGWSLLEAYAKSKENKQKNHHSVYSKHYWMSKINPKTNAYYSESEAIYETNVRRPIRKEYWIKKGYTNEEAIQKAIETKDSNNKKGAKTQICTELRRASSKRCIEHYLAKGYNYEESKKMLSNAQKFFSKEICIKKYGEEEGLKIWQNRQDNWQATLNNKTDDEKARINRLKIGNGTSISKAEKMILEQIRPILPEIDHQFTIIKDKKKQYIFDLAYKNKLIEYNGDFWHCNPKIYDKNYIHPRLKLTANEIWQKDAKKTNFAKSYGYEVLVVWEQDFRKNPEEIIKQCIAFLIK